MNNLLKKMSLIRFGISQVFDEVVGQSDIGINAQINVPLPNPSAIPRQVFSNLGKIPGGVSKLSQKVFSAVPALPVGFPRIPVPPMYPDPSMHPVPLMHPVPPMYPVPHMHPGPQGVRPTTHHQHRMPTGPSGYIEDDFDSGYGFDDGYDSDGDDYGVPYDDSENTIARGAYDEGDFYHAKGPGMSIDNPSASNFLDRQLQHAPHISHEYSPKTRGSKTKNKSNGQVYANFETKAERKRNKKQKKKDEKKRKERRTRKKGKKNKRDEKWEAKMMKHFDYARGVKSGGNSGRSSKGSKGQ